MPRSRRTPLLALGAALALAGCGDDDPTRFGRNSTLSLAVLGPDSLPVGGSVRFAVTRINATPADTGWIFWTVAPAGVARISDDGVVTALAPGVAYVGAQLRSASASRPVQVYEPTTTPPAP